MTNFIEYPELKTAARPEADQGDEESWSHREVMDVNDDEFMRWCSALKPCKYCGRKFRGPVCECEQR